MGFGTVVGNGQARWPVPGCVCTVGGRGKTVAPTQKTCGSESWTRQKPNKTDINGQNRLRKMITKFADFTGLPLKNCALFRLSKEPCPDDTA
jgi:hypothetical protein